MAVRVEKAKPSAQQIRTLVGTPDATPGSTVPLDGVVVAEKDGPVTKVDKAKAYYKALIALVGSLLVGANQVLPLVPDDAKGWVSTAVAVLTVASVALKSNEQWFDEL
jgi:hypothetical protein